MCNLKEFLKTGKSGGISLGSSLENIRTMLGEPSLSTHIKPNIDIWKYDDLELTFESGKIKQIKIDLNDPSPQLPIKFTQEPWQINQSMKIEDLLDLIDNYKISWRVSEKWSFDRQLCLVTEGGVLLYLDLDRREFRSIVVVTK